MRSCCCGRCTSPSRTAESCGSAAACWSARCGACVRCSVRCAGRHQPVVAFAACASLLAGAVTCEPHCTASISRPSWAQPASASACRVAPTRIHVAFTTRIAAHADVFAVQCHVISYPAIHHNACNARRTSAPAPAVYRTHASHKKWRCCCCCRFQLDHHLQLHAVQCSTSGLQPLEGVPRLNCWPACPPPRRSATRHTRG